MGGGRWGEISSWVKERKRCPPIKQKEEAQKTRKGLPNSTAQITDRQDLLQAQVVVR